MLLELETDPAVLLDAELEEQLEWAPPELEDEPESTPLFPTTMARLEVLGPLLAALGASFTSASRSTRARRTTPRATTYG